MGISPILLFKLLLASFLWGITVGIFNDLNRIFRVLLFTDAITDRVQKYYELELPIVKSSLNNKLRLGTKKRNRLRYNCMLALQDFFLTLVYIVGLVFLNYELNKGDFRFFTVIFSLSGAVLYYFTVGKIVFNLSEFICFIIRAIFVIVFYVFFTPIMYILTKIRRFFEKIYIFFQNTIAKNIKKRYNKYKEKNLNRKSIHAFLKS